MRRREVAAQEPFPIVIKSDKFLRQGYDKDEKLRMFKITYETFEKAILEYTFYIDFQYQFMFDKNG